MKKYNIVLSVLFLLLAAAMYVGASGLTVIEGSMGPGTWPKVLAVLLAVLAVLLLVQSLADKSGSAAPVDIHSPGFKRVLLGAGAIAVFCVLLKFLGFMIAAAFLVPAVMRIMDEKRIPVLAGVTVGVLVSIYVIFVVALNLPLPHGSLF